VAPIETFPRSIDLVHSHSTATSRGSCLLSSLPPLLPRSLRRRLFRSLHRRHLRPSNPQPPLFSLLTRDGSTAASPPLRPEIPDPNGGRILPARRGTGRHPLCRACVHPGYAPPRFVFLSRAGFPDVFVCLRSVCSLLPQRR
jgi:hypothetical protein